MCWAEVESPKTALLAFYVSSTVALLITCPHILAGTLKPPECAAWELLLAPCPLPSMVPMCSDSLQCHLLEDSCRIVYFNLGWVYLNVCPYAGNPSSMQTQSSWNSWLLFLAMTISQRLGAVLFMFNLLSVHLWISLCQTEMSQMGNMCGRGLCFWTSTILLCFSPSSTTHFEKSQGNRSPDHWQKQQNLPLRTRMRDNPGAQQLFRELTQFGRMKDSHQAGRDRQEKASAARHQERFSQEELKANFVSQC